MQTAGRKPTNRASKLVLVVAVGFVTGLTACGESSFKGSDPKKPGYTLEPASEKTLAMSCDATGMASLQTDLTGTSRDLVKITGEFCNVTGQPGRSGDLDVVFTLDFSGSMKANDPGTGTSCGRLDAAKAIHAKLVSALAQNAASARAKVRVGVVGFDTTSALKVPLTNVNEFATKLNYETFCGFNDKGYTNYASAFDATREVLRNSLGSKVVYLISDGMPTVGGALFQTPQSAGKQSADQLRNEIKDLTFNAVFLQPKSDADGDPKVYLESLTGSADRVRLVASADQIGAQIVTFQDPVAGTLDGNSANGTISTVGFAQRTIKITKLEADAARQGVWKFETAPFTLNAAAAQKVSNEIVIKIKASDGSEKTATARINFSAR